MKTINLCCPHCHKPNRLPEIKLENHPVCGACKQVLFSKTAVELTSLNLQNHLLKSDIPVVVDCWASWCGPCQQFGPIFEQAAAELEPRIRFAKLNTEQEQDIAQRWSIRSIPTIILFKHGKERARINGALSKQQFKQWLLHQGG